MGGLGSGGAWGGWGLGVGGGWGWVGVGGWVGGVAYVWGEVFLLGRVGGEGSWPEMLFCWRVRARLGAECSGGGGGGGSSRSFGGSGVQRAAAGGCSTRRTAPPRRPRAGAARALCGAPNKPRAGGWGGGASPRARRPLPAAADAPCSPAPHALHHPPPERGTKHGAVPLDVQPKPPVRVLVVDQVAPHLRAVGGREDLFGGVWRGGFLGGFGGGSRHWSTWAPG